MYRRALSFFAIVILTSCNDVSDDTTRSKGSIDTTATLNLSKKIPLCKTVELDERNIYSIQNNDFVLDAVENDLLCDKLKSTYSTDQVLKQVSKNQHTNLISDTTLIYRSNCDSLSIISTSENCFPTHLIIFSNKVTLQNGNIVVGMSKESFLRKINLKATPKNIIKLTETENANELIFMFENGSLISFIYNNLYYE